MFIGVMALIKGQAQGSANSHCQIFSVYYQNKHEYCLLKEHPLDLPGDDLQELSWVTRKLTSLHKLDCAVTEIR